MLEYNHKILNNFDNYLVKLIDYLARSLTHNSILQGLNPAV